MTNLFEIAVRKKLRFASARGNLTMEQLFEVPLTARDGYDLDTIAKDINNQLKASAEESFVAKKTTKNADLETKLEILKLVIAEKIAAADAKKAKAERDVEVAKLKELLADKKDEALKAMSAEEIAARLAALQG